MKLALVILVEWKNLSMIIVFLIGSLESFFFSILLMAETGSGRIDFEFMLVAGSGVLKV